MISAMPLEYDPDRDLYEAPPPVAKPSNKTGSNNTPLGAPQDQPPEALKRKGPENSTSSMPAKRPRVDVGRASALVQASLPAGVGSSTDRVAWSSTLSGDRRASISFRAQSVKGPASRAPGEPLERNDSNALFISGVKDEEEATGLLAEEDRTRIEKLQKIKHFFVAYFNSPTDMRMALGRVSVDVKNARGGPNQPSVKVFNDRAKASRHAAGAVNVHLTDSLQGQSSTVDNESEISPRNIRFHMG